MLPGGILRITAAGFNVGFGYVPARSPPAGPQGNADTFGANFSCVIAPSTTVTATIAVSAVIACTALNDVGTVVNGDLGNGSPLPTFISNHNCLLKFKLIGVLEPRYKLTKPFFTVTS